MTDLATIERTVAPFEVGDVVTFASKGREMTVARCILEHEGWEATTVWLNSFGEPMAATVPAATLELAA